MPDDLPRKFAQNPHPWAAPPMASVFDMIAVKSDVRSAANSMSASIVQNHAYPNSSGWDTLLAEDIRTSGGVSLNLTEGSGSLCIDGTHPGGGNRVDGGTIGRDRGSRVR